LAAQNVRSADPVAGRRADLHSESFFSTEDVTDDPDYVLGTLVAGLTRLAS
jgi:hypothetical protein